MRVAANTFSDSLVDQLSRLAVRQSRLQNQAATGQRIRDPADDPAAMRRVLNFQADGSAINQFQRNIDLLTEQANASYGAMRAIKNVSDRAAEITVLADGTKSRTELDIYGQQVSMLIQQAVASANGKFRDHYLFGGTRNDQPPFQINLDANGRVVAVTYAGNQTRSENEVGDGVLMSAQTIGANSSGSGPRGLISDSRVGADFFNHLISLQNNLFAGDVDAIGSQNRAELDADEENLLFHFGTVGATLERLETTSGLLAQQAISLEKAVSTEVDADLAQTLVRLNETQTAYQAALQSGSRILGVTLLDYLR